MSYKVRIGKVSLHMSCFNNQRTLIYLSKFYKELGFFAFVFCKPNSTLQIIGQGQKGACHWISKSLAGSNVAFQGS